jgi:hypothetical protein
MLKFQAVFYGSRVISFIFFYLFLTVFNKIVMNYICKIFQLSYLEQLKMSCMNLKDVLFFSVGSRDATRPF